MASILLGFSALPSSLDDQMQELISLRMPSMCSKYPSLRQNQASAFHLWYVESDHFLYAVASFAGFERFLTFHVPILNLVDQRY